MMATYRDFFTAWLNAMGFPVTQANLNACATISIFEGPNDRYNPFNCELQYGTSTAFNSVGVQDYKNFEQGVAASHQFFQGDHWAGVRAAMRAGSPYSVVMLAWRRGYTWAKLPSAYPIGSIEARLNLTIGAGPTQGVDDVTPADIEKIIDGVMNYPIRVYDNNGNPLGTAPVRIVLEAVNKHVNQVNLHTAPKPS